MPPQALAISDGTSEVHAVATAKLSRALMFPALLAAVAYMQFHVAGGLFAFLLAILLYPVTWWVLKPVWPFVVAVAAVVPLTFVVLHVLVDSWCVK